LNVSARRNVCCVIVILKCGCIAVFKRSVEDGSKSFAMYAGDKILQFYIVNMPEVFTSEENYANP
jgi:hypothetical protein